MFKKLLLITLAFILLLSFAGTAFCNESLSERQAKYDSEKRNQGVAALLSFIPYTGILGLGHLYAGDWGRSTKFILSQLFAGVIGLAGTEYNSDTHRLEQNPTNVAIGTTIYLIAWIWQIADSALTAEDHNKMLRQKYGLEVVLRDNAPALQFTLRF